MGRIFLVYFDETPDNRFYLCAGCQAHIALAKHSVNRRQIPDEQKKCQVVQVNAIVDGPKDHFELDANIIANVHCVGCNECLGMKCIELGRNHEGLVEGAVDLNVKKLHFWDGNRIRPLVQEEETIT